MQKAYVDTTVLTNTLLKRNWPDGKAASAALGRYSETKLPVYAIKEFKCGPLAHFAWVHNKLASTRSVAQTVAAIRTVGVYKRYQGSTALEALGEAMRVAGSATTTGLVEKYGEQARSDQVLCDQYRLALKALIFRAWERRRKVTTAVIQHLSCYSEQRPYEQNGLVEVEPKTCSPTSECCLGPALRANQNVLKTLKATIEQQAEKPENNRRAKALESVISGRLMTEKMCRDLGDAIFVFFSPEDCAILTTNLRDFEPLAHAIGKAVDTP